MTAIMVMIRSTLQMVKVCGLVTLVILLFILPNVISQLKMSCMSRLLIKILFLFINSHRLMMSFWNFILISFISRTWAPRIFFFKVAVKMAFTLCRPFHKFTISTNRLPPYDIIVWSILLRSLSIVSLEIIICLFLKSLVNQCVMLVNKQRVINYLIPGLRVYLVIPYNLCLLMCGVLHLCP